jgi:hypothetical protein
MIRFVKNGLQSLKSKVSRRPYDYLSACVFALERWQYDRHRNSAGAHLIPDSFEASVIASLKEKGFYVWDGFLSPETCATLRGKIESIAIEHPELVHPGTKHDLRLHGIENISDDFKFMAAHRILTKIASVYLGESTRTAFSLAARLESSESKIGSGGGWHRDSSFPQLKAMAYLSDVEECNGPFQLLSGSHVFLKSIRDNIIGKQKYGEVRWRGEEVEQVLSKTDRKRLNTFVAKQGTLIIFDSSTIHRGSPISEGRRYAVTNYFYPERFIDSSLYKHFSPVAGHLG